MPRYINKLLISPEHAFADRVHCKHHWLLNCCPVIVFSLENYSWYYSNHFHLMHQNDLFAGISSTSDFLSEIHSKFYLLLLEHGSNLEIVTSNNTYISVTSCFLPIASISSVSASAFSMLPS